MTVATQHHSDCDGYRIAHKVTIVDTWTGSKHTPRLYHAECEECGKLHIGSTGSKETARSFAAGHSSEVECDGRCMEWQ